MARLVGPDDGSRLAYQILADNTLGSASGLTAVYYADEAATTLADIITYPDGDAIAGSAMTVAATSLLPLLKFPDGVDTVYVKVNGGPVTAVYSRVEASDILPVGTASSTVAAGDDSRIVGAQQRSELTTKGDLYVATGAGIVVRLPVGANDQVLTAQSGETAGMEWADIVGGGGGGFIGAWDPAVEYQPGAIVQYGDLLYGTIDGAPVGEQPDTVVPLNTVVPTTTATGDGTDYQFVAQVTATELTRVEGVDFYKLAGQSAVPHELRAYDISWGTTSPLAVATVPNEVGAAVGFQTAPMVGDMRAGRTYGFTFVAGTVAEDTYAYTAGFAFGGTVGALTLVAGGFVASHANITTISSPTTYYTAVGPRFRRRNQYWTRLVAGAPVWIGSNRAVTYAPS